MREPKPNGGEINGSCGGMEYKTGSVRAWAFICVFDGCSELGISVASRVLAGAFKNG